MTGRARLPAARGRARDAMFAHLRGAEALAGLRSAVSAAPRLDAPRGSMGRVAAEALEGALRRVQRALEGELHDADVLTELLAGDEGALDAARAAVAGRRAERLTGLAAPLALLAVDLKER